MLKNGGRPQAVIMVLGILELSVSRSAEDPANDSWIFTEARPRSTVELWLRRRAASNPHAGAARLTSLG